MFSINTQFILSNLKEAEEQLVALIAQIESDKDFSFEDYHIAMGHLYRHLNSAWNGRCITRQEWQKCSDENFQKWQKFPDDLPLIGMTSISGRPNIKTMGKIQIRTPPVFRPT